MAEKKTEGLDTPVNITVRSYRRFKHDTDGVSVKAVLDGLVQRGILQDDSWDEVKKVAFESIKIKKGEKEKTQIIIEEVNNEV